MAFGLATFLTGFLKLRSYEARPPAIRLLMTLGLCFIMLSLFPGLATLPSQLISLGEIPGGRIITLLIIATLSLCLFLIMERGQTERLRQQLELLVRHQVVEEFHQRNVSQRHSEFVLVVVPAFEEADNLKVVLPQIPTAVEGLAVQVLVIDDGSQDGTAATARHHGAWVASHPFRLGGGAALLTGYELARKLNPSIIVTMDGDGQHLPSEIPEVAKPVAAGQADMVIGSRILGGHKGNSWLRHLGVISYSRLINLLMGTKITDCTSGFRSFRRAILDEVRLEESQYHTTEMIIEVAKNGLRIREQPISFSRRLSGKSKKGNAFFYGWGVLFIILRTWLR